MTYHHNNKDPNLNNLHHAMEYRDGLPHVRVNLGGDTITITGSVNVGTEVKINNTEEQSIPVHLTDDPIGVTQSTTPWVISKNTNANSSSNPLNVNFTNTTIGTTFTNTSIGVTQGTTPWQISKDSNANGSTNPIYVNFTNSTIGVTGSVSAAVSGTVALDSATLSALEDINATVSGTVTIQDGGNSITVDGTVALDTATLAALETITVNQGTNPWLVSNINNYDIDNAPWQLQVALGKVTGVTGLSISGYGASVGTEFIPAWELDTAYTYLPSAQTVRVWSNSVSDTNVTVTIIGLDANYVQQTETLTLTNGITGVLSTKQFLRINNLNLGGTVQNVGEIHVGSSDKTITSAFFGPITNVTAGRSQMSMYTVPAGYTFYLTQSNWYTNQTGSQTALYRSWTRSAAGIISIVLNFPMQQQYNSVKVVPRAYTEKTDIQWQVASSSGTSKIGGQVEGYLIQNGL